MAERERQATRDQIIAAARKAAVPHHLLNEQLLALGMDEVDAPVLVIEFPLDNIDWEYAIERGVDTSDPAELWSFVVNYDDAQGAENVRWKP